MEVLEAGGMGIVAHRLPRHKGPVNPSCFGLHEERLESTGKGQPGELERTGFHRNYCPGSNHLMYETVRDKWKSSWEKENIILVLSYFYFLKGTICIT